MLKTAHFALALSLLLPLAPVADAAPHASSSHGFSSHSSSSHASASRAAPSPSRSGFGAFSRQSSAAAPARSAAQAAPARPGGGFGSFGSAPAAPGQSDSKLSQQLSQQSAQARALQTLDQRNAARAAQNAPQPVPGYGNGASPSNGAPLPPAGMQAPAPAAPATIVVQRERGSLAPVIAGAMIAHSAGAHANTGYVPAPGTGNGGVNASGGGVSFFSLFMTLCLPAAIAWGLWFAWRGWRRHRAARQAADKPNYSFERN
jgi:hypothetical protein